MENQGKMQLSNINNEMLRHSTESTKILILFLITLCFKYLVAPGEMLYGLTISLHKKDTKTNPSNYKGIAMLDNVSKVYPSVLIKRMLAFGESKECFFSEEQYGYREGRGSTEVRFMMQSMIYLNYSSTLLMFLIDQTKV